MKNNFGKIKCDVQMAAAYILYMIAGSYFKKACATSSILEISLYGQYKELATQKQERKEDFIDSLMNRLGDVYLKALGSLRCVVHISKQKETYFIWFETGFEELIAVVDESGRTFLETAYAIPKEDWMYHCDRLRKKHLEKNKNKSTSYTAFCA